MVDNICKNIFTASSELIRPHGFIAGPPVTEVWTLYVTAHTIKEPIKAFTVAAFNSDGSLKCSNGFILDPKGYVYGSYDSFSPAMVHDGDKAYIIAPIITSSNAYTPNPLILARYNGECGLDTDVSYTIGSPQDTIYITDAIYSSGYIYATGLYNTGGQVDEESRILFLKISPEPLAILRAKTYTMPWPGAIASSPRIDGSGNMIAVTVFYNGDDTKGLATMGTQSINTRAGMDRKNNAPRLKW